jgi:hypothetical protein
MEPRRRGRPREMSEQAYPITTRLPASDHDAIMRMAIRSGKSVHQEVRDAVRLYVARNRQHSTR